MSSSSSSVEGLLHRQVSIDRKDRASALRSGRSTSSHSRRTSISSISTIKPTTSPNDPGNDSRHVSSATKRRPPDSECIKVAVRCRPMSEKEIADGHESIIEFASERGEVIINNPNLEPSNLLGTRKSGRRNYSKVFKFDAVFDWNSKQDDIYDTVCKPIVDSVLEGFNGTIFAYGQTGTGKTYTMEGLNHLTTARRRSLIRLSDNALATSVNLRGNDQNRRGMIPKAFEHIFHHISNNPNVQYLVRSSYLEIYQEEIRDLLSKDQTKRLELHEHTEIGVFVKDLTSFVCKSIKEIERVMSVGNQNRTVGATDMNEHSSRSHAIFMITIEQQQARSLTLMDGDGYPQETIIRKTAQTQNNRLSIKVGKLNLVDLAGSERQRKTNSFGQRQKEAIKINLSLSVLGKVINSLMAASSIRDSTDIDNNNSNDNCNVHTPYRDSKLTRLLQDSLGGNAKTLMLANIGPASYNYDETIDTLSYASRAKCIQNRPRINEDPKDALLREFQREIETLRAKLASIKQRQEENRKTSGNNDNRSGALLVYNNEFNGDVNERGSEVHQQQLTLQSEPMKQSDNSSHDEDEQYKELQSLKLKLKSLESKLLNSNDSCYNGGGTSNERPSTVTKLTTNNSISVTGATTLDAMIEGYTTKQESELEKRRQQLANHKEIEQDIKLRLSKQEEIELETKQTFSSLQQELDIKTTKLKSIGSQIQLIKKEIQRLQDSNRLELDELDQVQSVLLKELKLKYLIMNNFIPKEYTDRLFKQQRIVYNENDNTCHLKRLEINQKQQQQVKLDDATSSSDVIDQNRNDQEHNDDFVQMESLPRYITNGRLRARSKFEKIGETIGSNIRYRYENILEPKLVLPNCTLRSYQAPLVSPKIQAALDKALSKQEKDIFI